MNQEKNYAKCLVFSDAHGNRNNMEEALALHKDASLLLFLGDGLRDFQAFHEAHPQIEAICVAGNCDFLPLFDGLAVPPERIVPWHNVRLLLGHGHTWGVKYTELQAEAAAHSASADILLFGHTHEPANYYRKEENGRAPLWVLNPGSIRDGNYGLIELIQGQPLLSSLRLF